MEKLFGVAMKKIGSTVLKSLTHVTAFIGVLGILAAPREKAWANEVTHRETIYNTDYVSASVGGLRNTATASLRLAGVSGPVSKAYLYWHGPMNSTNPLANATIKFSGQTITGVNIGYSDDNCWGFNNSQAYRADVTPIVAKNRNASYSLASYVKQGTNINANGASLLVFYNDSNTNNNRDIVLFDGNDSNADNFYDAAGWNVSLGGLSYAAGTAIVQMHVSDGQTYEDAALLINGYEVEGRGQVFQGNTVTAANNGPGSTGRLWDVISFDVTSLLAAGSNSVDITHAYLGTGGRAKGDCVSLVAAVIDLPAGSAPPPPAANTPPSVTGTPEISTSSPEPITLQAQALDNDGDALTYIIRINDAVAQTGTIPAGSPATTGPLTVNASFNPGRHTVQFTVNDGVTSGSFTTIVNVTDDQPPVLNVPANMTVPSAPGRGNATVTYEVTATDDFPGVTVISLPGPGSTFPIGTTTVTATAVDAAGHRVQKSFTITVIDAMPPSILCPSDILKLTDPGKSNAVVHFSVNATDNLPGAAVSCSPASGSTFQLGITTVVCSARDARGNRSSCMFTVTIIDREAPTLVLPPDLTLQNDPNEETRVVNYEVEVRDNAPGASVFCFPPSGSAFPIGTTNVLCIGSDASGNNVTNSFAVTIFKLSNPNVVPPTVNVPASFAMPTDPGLSTAVVEFNATVNSPLPGATIACVPPSGATFALGTTTVMCVGRDVAGNTASNSFNILVYDNEKPLLKLPANIVLGVDEGQNHAVVNYSATATDNSGSVSLVCVPMSGSAFPLGITTVTCNAIDNAGNAASGSFTITVTNSVVTPVDYGCVTASRSTLWPPQHQMVPVSLWLNYDAMPVSFSSVRVVSVTSNEPETGLWADDVGPDWEITDTGNLKVSLRTERDDNGSGRIYTIWIEGRDARGQEYLCSTTVTVPKTSPKKTKPVAKSPKLPKATKTASGKK